MTNTTFPPSENWNVKTTNPLVDDSTGVPCLAKMSTPLWQTDLPQGKPKKIFGHHKGVDIFAKKETPVLSATRGIVVFKGVLSKGGNALLILGPNLKFHYYAHLDTFEVGKFSLVNAGDVIGSAGNTGNAKGKPYHLHYSIRRVLPKLNDSEISNKRFYDDPVVYLNKTF